ncbi:FKBP-type peptidyl-prolyl cis-trans isomerase [Flavobacterium sp. HJJ]|uniref:FKBP-type peptidyl-prolyl cis-trans isomerase n=1 Tax=Flavobacterium sp. HJJ TaxID=2783792 RepID=UPI00188CBCE7|nr:FKBP-type peptidyl-prolyl cis-trans isomerase [Flavobacterium sp. HJJ]MBF4473129.1 FKBP-type peptidyl-prolyl cis-trans isomerase [Flavobacterium sp. HJJ]
MKYSILAIIAVLFISCTNNDNELPAAIDYTAQNEAEIKAYIADNKLDAKRSDSGLYYVINEAGTGKQPTSTSTVKVTYKGYFTNKIIFDQNNTGISFNLQQVIKGWTEGLTYFKEGGSGILLVPAHLGYGSYNYNGIPGGSVLIFDVSLITVN